MWEDDTRGRTFPTGLRAAACVASRPLNRILIAQRVATPQMFVSIGVAALHVGVNHLLVNSLGLGFLGAAWAIGIASFNTTLFTAMWVAVAGMQDRVWGRPTWGAFQVFAVSLLCILRLASRSCCVTDSSFRDAEPSGCACQHSIWPLNEGLAM